ncbi:MAG: hypothetical protein LUJ25_03195 [Firmicutes bacterium]|nr:hypothetical protein [Bacillota bacterium]
MKFVIAPSFIDTTREVELCSTSTDFVCGGFRRKQMSWYRLLTSFVAVSAANERLAVGSGISPDHENYAFA